MLNKILNVYLLVTNTLGVDAPLAVEKEQI